MAANSAVVQDIMRKEGKEEMPEMMEPIPASESSVDELMQPSEPQANDVGFKKVFKFVGFKFTVKKDKTARSLTACSSSPSRRMKVKGQRRVVRAGDHPEPSREPGDATPKDGELRSPPRNRRGTPT